jgi:hypothetical protein
LMAAQSAQPLFAFVPGLLEVKNHARVLAFIVFVAFV